MITGTKVELRPVSLEDFRRTYEWRNDEETAKLEAGTSLFRFSHVPFEQIESSYEKEIISLDKREEGKFSIYTRGEHSKHIGLIVYRELNIISRRCTLGIGIGDKEYWNNGYGSDALKALIHYLFETMNLNRVQLDTWSGNVRAIRSYEKCGFVVEGRLRNDAYIDGKYYDTVIMGLLKEDFKMREKRI
ncbi:GNAT family N-acetyltransferase [Paenibacillus albidus]|uniref:GNAT family N-acetyltransferase n=1 Tax=Paenibacillus albidus TaxID=2041023 RepID=UPI001BED3689|nr:GNAT family protein [Paenibacillus albidus]MBT2291500.1 GNAT family N-acetyltransferase [Paenibacillus albidus]